jgi:hypothetical protein
VCLFAYFSNSLSTNDSSGYTATARHLLKKLLKHLHNGAQYSVTNAQILNYLEYLVAELAIVKNSTINTGLEAMRKATEKSTTNSFKNQLQQLKTLILEDIPTPEIFYLERLSQIRSKHIVICVSGYLSQTDNQHDEWKKLTQLYPHSEFFALHWRSSSILEVGLNAIATIVGHKPKIWKSYYQEAVKTGKFLAHVLADLNNNIKIFENCCISLVGFSLGTVVITNCLLELEHLKCYDIIHEVLLMGGVANIQHFNEYGNIHTVVAGDIINVYSKSDSILSTILPITHRVKIKPMGLNEKKMNFSKYVNYDATELIGGHLWYRAKLDEVMHAIDFNDDFLYLIDQNYK